MLQTAHEFSLLLKNRYKWPPLLDNQTLDICFVSWLFFQHYIYLRKFPPFGLGTERKSNSFSAEHLVLAVFCMSMLLSSGILCQKLSGRKYWQEKNRDVAVLAIADLNFQGKKSILFTLNKGIFAKLQMKKISILAVFSAFWSPERLLFKPLKNLLHECLQSFALPISSVATASLWSLLSLDCYWLGIE